ncbi:type II restriction endonuclease [Fervidobacterium islandicum]|uniref:Type-2 restriction enzyme n=1 Tax=Fervidobacterium islandicum TaxID=2423 RepID=A0AAI8CMU7_FERIS|nr:type II restriction endonuclease [Fervidobacterium islandicum]AMW33267.1 type II restriction endonuclease [Fervidobacterium islandicum]
MENLYIDILRRKGWNVSDAKDVVEKFLGTILKTNKTYNFFVDWDKVKEFVEKHRIEINILSTLIHSADFDSDLRKILRKYPEVLAVIPMLIAVRENSISVLLDTDHNELRIDEYDFTVRTLNEQEINYFVEFFEKTGLKSFFLNTADKSLYDYLVGVEVGLDTNARKNRSGFFLEKYLNPIVKSIAEKYGYNLLVQKKFSQVPGVNISELFNRKADYILFKDDSSYVQRLINIEVNFYNVTGSKPQEIIDSYIERQNELKKYGFEFILITDGPAWNGQRNQLFKAFENISYVLNIHFVQQGVLEEIICGI